MIEPRDDKVSRVITSSDTVLVVRRARKPWRCICADEFKRFEVVAVVDGVETSSIAKRTRHEAEVHAEHLLFLPQYDSVVVRPIRNPNYRPFCLRDITPGDIYVEYMGEAEPFRHGSSYCEACAVAVWAEVRSEPICETEPAPATRTYHVNVTTEFERDVYVEAESAERAEQLVRDMSRDPESDFWEDQHWSLAAEGSTDYFVETSSGSGAGW
jgi:hypothetical protein